MSNPTKAEPTWVSNRRARLLPDLDLSRTRGIEIGPLATPLVIKPEADVRYVDYADKAALQRKYLLDPNVRIEDIVDVDVIWGERTLAECFPMSEISTTSLRRMSWNMCPT